MEGKASAFDMQEIEKEGKSKREMGGKGQRLLIQHLRTGLNPNLHILSLSNFGFIHDQSEAR